MIRILAGMFLGFWLGTACTKLTYNNNEKTALEHSLEKIEERAQIERWDAQKLYEMKNDLERSFRGY